MEFQVEGETGASRLKGGKAKPVMGRSEKITTLCSILHEIKVEVAKLPSGNWEISSRIWCV